MAEHKHGEMDTTVQEKTFEGFLKMCAWVASATILVLIVAALINS